MATRALWLSVAVALLCATPFSAVLGATGSPELVDFARPADLALDGVTPTASNLPPVSAHDLKVSASNVTTLAGMAVNFTATIAGALPVSTTWWWGDGTSTTSGTSPVAHTFANPGIYLVYAQGTNASGGVHDNLGALLRFAVLDSYSGDVLGNEAQVDGSIVANNSTIPGAQAVVDPGGLVQVSNWIASQPTNPSWAVGIPSYSLDSAAVPYANLATLVGGTGNLSAATTSWSSATPEDSYFLNFSVPVLDTSVAPALELWNNFTFTVFVGTSAATPVAPVPTSPHNGTLEVYQVLSVAPDLATLDPALADDPTDGPILQNIYQTLVVYNGSHAGPAPSDFVPDLATCVPGSVQCQAMYGSSLVSGDNWTFVLNPNATFYNGSSGASWAVYPNDVAFSFARSCLLADSTGGQASENFVLCQALLPPTANGSWDGGAHAPWNNTPANILSAITVNSSAYCTPLMEDGVHGNGCITLDTAASGRAWPEFLEFVESTSGWAVVPCSWAASEGLGLPGWYSGTTCYRAPPGSPGNPNPVPGTTAWDGYEMAQGSYVNVPTTALRSHALGSGPYYLASYDNQTGYTLKASPVWGGTTCLGGSIEGCLPAATKGGIPPTYIPNVVSTFELSNGPGLAALASGSADLVDTTGGGGNAGYGGNGTTIISELRAGELDYLVGPAITTLFGFPELQYNVSAAAGILGAPVTLPARAFEDLAFRQFWASSYPHATATADDCIIEGILYCFTAGGAIPYGMGNYYPTNISWPFGNADTNPADVGSAAWWWAQVQTDGAVGAACTPSTPCTFPLPAYDPSEAVAFQSWAQAMDTISGGAIDPTVVSVSLLTELLDGFFEPAGNASFPVASSGWAPDFFDPTDYVSPTYLPGGTFTSTPGFAPILETSSFEAACAGPASDPTITQSCQGTAYEDLVALGQQASVCTPPSCSEAERVLLYEEVERIADGLGLSVNMEQQAAVYAFAPWIDASSLLQNPDRNNVWGGEVGDQPFFLIQYATSIPQGYGLEVALQSPTTGPTSTALRLETAAGSLLHPGAVLTLEAGETFLVLASVSGGTGVYRYDWTGLPTGCTGTSAAVLVCRPSAGGNVSLGVTVVDSAGRIGVSNAVPLAVVPHVAIASFGITPSSLRPGTSISLAWPSPAGWLRTRSSTPVSPSAAPRRTCRRSPAPRPARGTTPSP